MSEYSRPKDDQHTRHLWVGNAGPGVGVSPETVQEVFEPYGAVSIAVPQPARQHVYVSFSTEAAATKALQELHGKPVAAAGGRCFYLGYAARKERQSKVLPPVALTAEACGVEGLALYPEFVTPEEEAQLLAAVEEGPWETLARRRVQHYGFKFAYKLRNVDRSQPGQPFPTSVQPIAARMQQLAGMPVLDQLTVNEYPAGVGLSPHVDTHSAFTGAIASLSLAGPAVMEFRQGDDHRPLFLPARSLVVLGGEARYAWQHYIPHRKADWVNGELVARGTRRVSFTFRQARGFPCDCQYREHCDSQAGSLPPTRMLLADGADQIHASEHAACSPANGICSSQSGNTDASGHHLAEDRAALPGRPAASSARSRDQPSCSTDQAECGGRQLSQLSIDSSAQSGAAGQRPAAVLQNSPSQGTASQTVAESSGRQALLQAHGNGVQSTSSEQRNVALASEPDAEFSGRQLESEFVNDMYNAIAPHFSATRFAIWPKVREFIAGLPAGAIVADAGCGNGKYFGVREDIAVLGSDRSIGLAEVAAKRLLPVVPGQQVSLRADVAVADAMALPYRTASCDGVLCIAVLHHISSPQRRVRMLAELARVLRPGGRAIVTVWASEQEDPKKLAKWQPMRPAGHASAQQAGISIVDQSRSDTASPCSEPRCQAEEAGTGINGAAAWTMQGGAHSGSSSAATRSRDASAHVLDPGRAGRDASVSGAADALSCSAGRPQAAQASEGPDEGPSNNGGDYFVPWHLPFHRVEAAAVVVNSRRAAETAKHMRASAADADGGTGQAAIPGGQVDLAKGTVMFKRYYHLFDEGELDQLVGCVPGVQLVTSFYDKSNWCVVFTQTA